MSSFEAIGKKVTEKSIQSERDRLLAEEIRVDSSSEQEKSTVMKRVYELRHKLFGRCQKETGHEFIAKGDGRMRIETICKFCGKRTVN